MTTTVNAPDIDTRRPIGHANYQRDVTADIQRHITEGTALGPNHMGEYMWPVTAVFDPATGVTRVGFTLIPAPDPAPEGDVA